MQVDQSEMVSGVTASNTLTISGSRNCLISSNWGRGGGEWRRAGRKAESEVERGKGNKIGWSKGEVRV